MRDLKRAERQQADRPAPAGRGLRRPSDRWPSDARRSSTELQGAVRRGRCSPSRRPRDGIPTVWVAAERVREVLALPQERGRRALPHALRPDGHRRARARAPRGPAGRATSPSSTTCSPSSATRTSGSRCRCAGEYPSLPHRHRPLARGQLVRARGRGTCSASRFDGHPHLRRILMPPTGGRAIRCARSTRRAPPRWARSSCPTTKQDARAGGAAVPARGVGPDARTATTPTSCSSTSARSTRARTACCASSCSSTARRSSTPCRDIGYHHRGAEKMGERQTWHTYIPYTDRVDYLGGVLNNLPYRAGGGEAGRHRGARPRAQVIRVMLCGAVPHHQPPGLVRHLRAGRRRSCRRSSTCSTTASARFDIVEAICGGRMHPSWFRIGGVAAGPAATAGTRLVRDFLDYLPPRLRRVRPDGDAATASSRRARRASARTRPSEAIEWGVTGPEPARLRAATGTSARSGPTRGYEQFEFDVPTGAARRLLRPRAWCASRRCGRACGSSSSAWRTCRPGAYKSRPPAGDAAAARSARCTTSRRSSTTSWASAGGR